MDYDEIFALRINHYLMISAAVSLDQTDKAKVKAVIFTKYSQHEGKLSDVVRLFVEYSWVIVEHWDRPINILLRGSNDHEVSVQLRPTA